MRALCRRRDMPQRRVRPAKDPHSPFTAGDVRHIIRRMAEGQEQRICYVISPIGEKVSATRKRSDQVLKHLIEPALAEFDYEIRRSDKDAVPGEIPGQIIEQMAFADLVVADLTDHNPNVFYELAIRHVAAKPLVQMIQADQEIPFDVSKMRTVYFNLSDPDELEDACNELTRHVEALQGVDEIETPVKASLRLKQALESSDPATAGNAEILAALQGMRHEIERLRVTQVRSSTAPASNSFYVGKSGNEITTWVTKPIKTFESYGTYLSDPAGESALPEEEIPADPLRSDAGEPVDSEE